MNVILLGREGGVGKRGYREAGRGGNPALRSQGGRAGTKVDVCTDPHLQAVIHGEKRGLSFCLRALPLSAHWIEILLLLAALLPTAQAYAQTYIFIYAHIGRMFNRCVCKRMCIYIYIYVNTFP